MTQTTTSNGRAARKSLSDQIDRLEGILDGLADALNESVADAVRDAVQVAVAVAVREAVQATVIEVLGNPAIRQHLAPPPLAVPTITPPAAMAQVTKPTVCQRLGGMVEAGWDWVVSKTVQVGKAITQTTHTCASQIIQTTQQGTRQVVDRAITLWQRLLAMASGVWEFVVLVWAILCQLRKPLLIALGVGVVVGLSCYFAGPVVACTISGLAGFGSSLIASLVRAAWQELSGLHSQKT